MPADDNKPNGCEAMGYSVDGSNNHPLETNSNLGDDVTPSASQVDPEQPCYLSERVLRMWNDPFNVPVCRIRVRLQSDVSYEPFMVGDSSLRQQFHAVVVTQPFEGLIVLVNKTVEYNDPYPEGYGYDRLFSGILRGYCEPSLMGCVCYHLEVVEEFPMCSDTHSRPLYVLPRQLFKLWKRPFFSSYVENLSLRLMSHGVVTYPGSFRSQKLPFSNPCNAILFRAKVVEAGDYSGLEVVVIRCFDEPQINPTNGVSMVQGRRCQVSGLLCSVHLNCCPAPVYYRLEATNVWRNSDFLMELEKGVTPSTDSKLTQQNGDFSF